MYALRLHQVKDANDESVRRLKYICKTLPIFDLYCSDTIRPKIELLPINLFYDDGHKEMHRNNVIIMFHQELINLWNTSITNQLKFDSKIEWINFWLELRNNICELANNCSKFIYKVLQCH